MKPSAPSLCREVSPRYNAPVETTFYKLRLCDSDIILVDDLAGDGKDRDWGGLARALLHRRRGAGADRMAVVSKPEDRFHLRVFTAEGEEGPCADAALCAARYLLDSGRSGADSVSLRALGADVQVDVLDGASLGLSLRPPQGVPDGAELGAAEAASRVTAIEASGERFQVLPLRVGAPPADSVAVFCDGGAARARARVASARGRESPAVVAVRVASRGELIASAPTSGRIDCCAAAAVALAASASTGYADREAMVRLGSSALWVEWTASGKLYVAARPEYVYRGEFHWVERDSESEKD
jgi:diaminopimelate epimerase